MQRSHLGAWALALAVPVSGLVAAPVPAASHLVTETQHVELGFSTSFPFEESEGGSGPLGHISADFAFEGEATISARLGADITFSYDPAAVVPGGVLPVDLTFTPTNDPGPELTVDVVGDVTADVSVSLALRALACTPILPTFDPILCATLIALNSIGGDLADFSLVGGQGDFLPPLAGDPPGVVDLVGDSAILQFAGLDLVRATAVGSMTVSHAGPSPIEVLGLELGGLGGAAAFVQVEGATLVDGPVVGGTILEWQNSGQTHTIELQLPDTTGPVDLTLGPVLHWLEAEADIRLEIEYLSPLNVLPLPGDIEVLSGSMGPVFEENDLHVRIGEQLPDLVRPDVEARVADGFMPVPLTDPPLAFFPPDPDEDLPPLGEVVFSITPPELTIDAAHIQVDEGDLAANTGTVDDFGQGPVTLDASVGTITDDGGGDWSWSLQTIDGPAESQTVTVSATNALGVTGLAHFDLTVDNVAPTVTIDPEQVTVLDEGDTITVHASFTDPGILDAPFTATVRCNDVPGYFSILPATVEIVSADPPLLHGTVSRNCTYGDTSQSGEPPSGTFTVAVTVTDKDGGSGTATFDVTVRNVDPTVTIDTTDTVDIGGMTTFFGKIGEPMDLAAQVTDPGSDDLFVTWDWGDGTDDSADHYLISAANPDPFPSPSIHSRNVTDTQTHTWAEACLYELVVSADDDDGGRGEDEAVVIISDLAETARGAGYWLHQYRGTGQAHHDPATLECYLQIVGHLSAVFDALTVDDAVAILHPGGNQGTMTKLLDRQLLAVWLNFANGAFGWDELVDTTGDGIPDTAFSAAVTAAESVRLDPDATKAELAASKDVLETTNLMHGG